MGGVTSEKMSCEVKKGMGAWAFIALEKRRGSREEDEKNL